MAAPKKRVVWPINPYESSEKLESNLVHFLQQLGNHFTLEVQPVYVMTSAFTQMIGYLKDVSYENLLRKAQEDCATYLKKFSQLPLLPVQMVENRVIFKSAEVSSFLGYLKSHPADFVCMTTYGKEKSQNIFLGSFAESYLRQSQQVTFVIGPHAVGGGDLSKALVPVEVTEHSREFVREILKLDSLSFLTKLKLFHKVTLEDYFQFNKDDLRFYGERGLSREEMMKIAQSTALEAFSEFGNNTSSAVEEVSCRVVKTDASVGDALLKEVQESDMGLIVMHSHTGPFLEAFVGSITKEVVTRSPVPVVVYPYQYKNQK